MSKRSQHSLKKGVDIGKEGEKDCLRKEEGRGNKYTEYKRGRRNVRPLIPQFLKVVRAMFKMTAEGGGTHSFRGGGGKAAPKMASKKSYALSSWQGTQFRINPVFV